MFNVVRFVKIILKITDLMRTILLHPARRTAKRGSPAATYIHSLKEDVGLQMEDKVSNGRPRDLEKES